MAPSLVTRTHLTDDSGAGLDGSIVNDSVWQALFDEIDLLFSGTGSYASFELGGKLKVDSAAGDSLIMLGGYEVVGIAAPAVSAAGRCRAYFDSSTNRLLLSENGGPFKSFGSLTVYAATLANAVNTILQTTVLSFTIPAGFMADGDRIDIQVTALEKNNTGGSQSSAWNVSVGSGADVAFAAEGFANSATEFVTQKTLTIQRRGSGVDVGVSGQPAPFGANPSAGGAIVGTSTPANFTGANVVNVKITMGTADLSYYFKPQSALVWHFRN